MPEQTTVTSSEQFSLNWRDLVRGTIVAAIGAAAGLVLGMLQAEDVVFNWTKVWQTAAAAGVAYLIKNFFDKPTITIVNPPKEAVQAVKDGAKEATVVTKS